MLTHLPWPRLAQGLVSSAVESMVPTHLVQCFSLCTDCLAFNQVHFSLWSVLFQVSTRGQGIGMAQPKSVIILEETRPCGYFISGE